MRGAQLSVKLFHAVCLGFLRFFSKTFRRYPYSKRVLGKVGEKRGALAGRLRRSCSALAPVLRGQRAGQQGYCSGMGCRLGRSLTRIEAERPRGSIGSVLLLAKREGKTTNPTPSLSNTPAAQFFDMTTPERAQSGSHEVRPSRASGGSVTCHENRNANPSKGALMQTMVCVRFRCPERSKGAVTTHGVSPA